LITLVGPGGVGKTRLAVEAAATLRVPDGVWLVELAPAAGVRAALEAVFKTSDLVRALRGTSPVIVLDNCEHLIDEAARVAQWLLGEVAGLRIIATSREPLNIPGEILHPVLPLAEEPAVELLRDRAAAARPDLVLAPAEAARICYELDGIPLAIELAAARLRTMPVSMLVEQLGDRLGFRGSRTSEPRHRTLRAVIDWSWNLLWRPRPPSRTCGQVSRSGGWPCSTPSRAIWTRRSGTPTTRSGSSCPGCGRGACAGGGTRSPRTRPPYCAGSVTSRPRGGSWPTGCA
jgi:predicted ATPase